jgi:hypothetical protein
MAFPAFWSQCSPSTASLISITYVKKQEQKDGKLEY